MRKTIKGLGGLLVGAGLLFNVACGSRVNDIFSRMEQKLLLEGNQTQLEERRYGLLISGGPEERFDKTAELIYKNLQQQIGIPEERIVVLSNKYNNKIINKDRSYKSSLRETLEKFSEITNPKDTLIIVYTGHGKGSIDSKSKSQIILKLGNKYPSEEFAKALRKIKGRKIVFIDSCYSGQFVDTLKKIPQTITIASSGGYSWGTDWERAFFKCPAEADRNNDGKVSVKENFDYAEMQDPYNPKSRHYKKIVSNGKRVVNSPRIHSEGLDPSKTYLKKISPRELKFKKILGRLRGNN